jgi:hypothetical protein
MTKNVAPLGKLTRCCWGIPSSTKLVYLRSMTHSIENKEELSTINQKIVAEGETFPSIKLKDGSKIQTGTVATLLHNVSLYNSGERGRVEVELKLAIPTLLRAGLFDLFNPEEWIKGNNPGRRFVGEEARRYLSENRQS